jgi:ABC-type lipoprotein export system ATPase subunit
MESALPIVRAQALVKHYRRGKVDVPALRGMSLTQEAGEFILLTGESGSGKSTFLNLCGCLDTPNAGTLTLFGEDVERLSDSARARLRKEKIGFIFQDFHLIPVLSALENVAYALKLRRESNILRRASAALAQVGLGDQLHAQVNALSGGQMQRVAIARALVGEPALVLADEPTANLDTHNKEQIMNLLQSMCRLRGTAVLLVTHDLSLSRWADRVVALRDGLVVPHEHTDIH